VHPARGGRALEIEPLTQERLAIIRGAHPCCEEWLMLRDESLRASESSAEVAPASRTDARNAILGS
jgi:hypothetical protein